MPVVKHVYIYNWVEAMTSFNDPGQEGWPCRVTRPR